MATKVQAAPPGQLQFPFPGTTGPHSIVEPLTSDDPNGPRQTDSLAFMVKLKAKPDLGRFQLMPRGEARKQAVYDAIVASSSDSQKSYIEIANQLKASGVIQGYETLYSPNMLIVHPVAAKMGEALKAFETPATKALYNAAGGTRIWPTPTSDADRGSSLIGKSAYGLDIVSGSARALPAPTEVPYGLTMIGAPQAWTQGADGAGLVFGSIDTGADVTHPAIRSQYRGLNADGTLTNDYNWADFDAKHSPAPVDSQGHGTHTIGTVLGTAGTVPIGVAPKAKWISTRALTGTSDNLLKALQWMQAPTKADGTAPDPRKAPDVVGMSWWTAPNYEDFFQESLENLRAAGIELVKSAGNNGPNPETISSPGQFPTITSVAAVSSKGQIASFSSRGPSPLPHTGSAPLWKPDISAPGVGVVSSVPGGYASYDGTSMAQPHMSGAILDILSKYPDMSHAQLIKALAAGATDAGATGRDLEFGYGIVNIPAALAAAAKASPEATEQPSFEF